MKRMIEILVVDDEPNIREGMKDLLAGEGFSTCTAANVTDAKKILEDRPIDVLITDVRLGQEDGMNLAYWSLENQAQVYVVIMTAYGTVHQAVEALKKGVYDYLTKPIKSEELLVKLHRIHEQIHLKDEVSALKESSGQLHPSLCGSSSAMKIVNSFVRRAAQVSSNVLLLGDTGTGKTLLAKVIHELSPRAENPYVAVNCASLSPTLIESELFGHVKGAFTGAEKDRIGKILKADGGTLFLDEIGSTSPAFQAKLLSVLQEKSFEPVGSDQTHRVDVRIIAATNSDLEMSVKEGRFREDLYYRLKVLFCELPPLKDRRDDIPELAQSLLQELKTSEGNEFSASALAALMSYEWPGNIRELRNAVEVAVASSEGKMIEPHHLPFWEGETNDEDSSEGLFHQTVAQVERALLRQTLKTVKGSISQAAELLGMNERSLRRRIRTHKLRREDFF